MLELIAKAREVKTGDKDFALFAVNNDWQAHLDNPSAHVLLGEVEDEIVGTGASAEEAVVNMVRKMEKYL